MPKNILVTGAAGFIGFHLAKRFLDRGDIVLGYDNLNDYYDPDLKRSRLDILKRYPEFTFVRGNLADRETLRRCFDENAFELVAHLAAQAGVRSSIDRPEIYIESNIVGFAHLLECCRHHGTPHLIYASSSSVYGLNTKTPFSETDSVDHPASLYAATKKSNELMAHVHSHLYGLPTTGLRFFTVYGPWGRPDMAIFKFTRAMTQGKPIEVYNHGRMWRDFTYIDDIIEGIVRVSDQIPEKNVDRAPYRLYNIGNNNPVELMRLISVIEAALGRKAEIIMKPMQPGDVLKTYADIDRLADAVGFAPKTSIEYGVERFVRWFQEYYCASAK